MEYARLPAVGEMATQRMNNSEQPEGLTIEAFGKMIGRS
jgi:hypothetical protein